MKKQTYKDNQKGGAYKYRFYPTPEEKDFLAKAFGHSRYIWNRILEWRTQLWKEEKVSANYYDACKRLTYLKKQPELLWLSEVPCSILQQVLRNQERAFKIFFKNPNLFGYPKIKKGSSSNSAIFTKSSFTYEKKDGEDAKICLRGGTVLPYANTIPLNIRWSRELPGEPTSVTITKDFANRYFISCVFKFKPKPLPVVNNIIGIDLGLTDLVVTSDGYKSGNPRYFSKLHKKLARAQRSFSRKKKGSNNREKARLKVARINNQITDSRKDFHQKLTTQLIKHNQIICSETLKIKNMVKNRRLAKHISDAGWGEVVRQLEYKADWRKREVFKVDTFFPSSKTCHNCGHVIDSLPLSKRSWVCPSCETKLDRDTNAAINIKVQGLKDNKKSKKGKAKKKRTILKDKKKSAKGKAKVSRDRGESQHLAAS